MALRWNHDLSEEEKAAYKRASLVAKRAGETNFPDFSAWTLAQRMASGQQPAAPKPVETKPVEEEVVEGRPWDESEFPAPQEDDGDDAMMIEEMPVVELEEPEPPQPIDRARILSALSEDLRSQLSDDDISEILEEERARAAAEAKEKALKKAREAIRHSMRVEQGLLDAATLRTREQNERLAKKIRIRFNLPNDGAGDPRLGANGFRVNGRVFEADCWHTVTLGEYESIAANHYQVWINQVQFETLNQSTKAGITNMNRLVGTTPARVLFARQPNKIEVEDVGSLH
jgi:hypothetical protein